MIVNVRGPCGGGKSTAVRAVLRSREMYPVFDGGRRRIPLGYHDGKLFIAGSYERETMGGIDTFESINYAFSVVREFSTKYHVLFEGKCQVQDVPHVLTLRPRGLTCVVLNVSDDDAVRGVRSRATANNIREEYIRRSWRKCQRDVESLEKADVKVLRVGRDEIVETIERTLKS